MEQALVLTYNADPTPAQLRLPPGSCDSHVHVFGPRSRFPYAPERRATPGEAPKERLFALHRLLGIDRCVIVQSVTHGFDNSVVEDAIAAGGGRYLGIALVPVGVSDTELERLATAGFRGVRFHFMELLGTGEDVESVIALTPRLAAVGMHLQVHIASSLVSSLAAALNRSAVPVVIDHMARVDARLGAEHHDFKGLMRLLENPRFHVKVSGIDRIDARAGPGDGYAAGKALAAMLVARFPEQCVWGTDWPHPNHTHVPDDATLVDALAEIAPAETLRERLLVHNPRNLYHFEA
jgi:2-pyrone-4,6-dicarboxylate lactonase